MTTEDKQKDVTAAEQRLQAGIDAYNDGELDVAAQAFGDAEIHFRLLGNFKRAEDSRSFLAEVQRENNQFQLAATSCQRAMQLYMDAGRPWHQARAGLEQRPRTRAPA